jgi:hypothetical protein
MIPSFKEFLGVVNEKSELDQNPVRTKQMDNVRYKISDTTQIKRFHVSIHPNISDVLAEILRGNKYVIHKEGNTFIIDSHPGDTGKTLQELMYSKLNDMFVNGDKRLVTYVGSDKLEDFIDADVHINIDMIR